MEIVLASLAVSMNDRAVTKVAMHRSFKTRWAKSDFWRTGEPFVSDDLVAPFFAAATFASSDAFRLLIVVSVSL